MPRTERIKTQRSRRPGGLLCAFWTPRKRFQGVFLDRRGVFKTFEEAGLAVSRSCNRGSPSNRVLLLASQEAEVFYPQGPDYE